MKRKTEKKSSFDDSIISSNFSTQPVEIYSVIEKFRASNLLCSASEYRDYIGGGGGGAGDGRGSGSKMAGQTTDRPR